MNVSIQETKIIHYAGKFCLRTARHAIRSVHVLNTQLPQVSAKHTIHLSSSNEWAEFWYRTNQISGWHAKPFEIRCIESVTHFIGSP